MSTDTDSISYNDMACVVETVVGLLAKYIYIIIYT